MIRSGCLLFEDAAVSFLLDVQSEDARNDLPESIQESAGIWVVLPAADGVNDVAPCSVGTST